MSWPNFFTRFPLFVTVSQKRETYDMEGLKDLLAPKTLHWFSYVANVCWILLGIILSAVFLDIENSEQSSSVFRCSWDSDNDINFLVESVTNNMKNNTTEIRYPYVWIRDY